jgi:hypothetical protein
MIMTTISFTKTTPPEWLLGFWKEIDDKTFGKGFDCFAENAVCNPGVADWHDGRCLQSQPMDWIGRPNRLLDRERMRMFALQRSYLVSRGW